MKNTAIKLAAAGITLSLFANNALANMWCGNEGQAPCEVPEPSTAYLFLGAAGVAALVAKFRKK